MRVFLIIGILGFATNAFSTFDAHFAGADVEEPKLVPAASLSKPECFVLPRDPMRPVTYDILIGQLDGDGTELKIKATPKAIQINEQAYVFITSLRRRLIELNNIGACDASKQLKLLDQTSK